jgi:hypothetical protein
VPGDVRVDDDVSMAAVGDEELHAAKRRCAPPCFLMFLVVFHLAGCRVLLCTVVRARSSMLHLL